MLFLAGACGLVYEIAWMRSFSLVFGSTVYATSTIVAVYMAGLAFGGFYFGRLIDRKHKPLKVFAFLQFGTALSALLIQLIFPIIGGLYAGIYRVCQGWMPAVVLLRIMLSFIVLIVPTTFMGALLPVISKFSIKSIKKLGLRVGGLYAVNTFGAVSGCLIAGFILIAEVGVNLSICIAAVVNIFVALVAIQVNKSEEAGAEAGLETGTVLAAEVEPKEGERTGETGKGEVGGREGSEHVPAIVLGCFALSGFASLAYEVIWFRILIMIFRNDVYAFSVMLATMLTGLAVGGFISSRFIDRVKDRLMLFGLMEVLIGLTAVASIPLYFWVNRIMSISPVRLVGPSGLIIVRQFIVAVLVIIVPSVCIGAVFPIVSRIYTRSRARLGGGIGDVFSVNTAGSILGSLAASFLLIPVLGVWKSLIVIAFINVYIGWRLFSINASLKKWMRYIMQGFVVLAGTAMVIYFFTDGVYAVKKDIKGRAGRVIYSKEGTAATVMVVRAGEGGRNLQINRILALDTTSGSMQTVRLLGNLPMLLHPGPERVLIIGFGMGVTAWSVLRHNAKEVDCIEIIPGVKDTAEYFRDVNNNVLDDPKIRLVIGDGRSHILTADKKYDVITCDPIHPGLGSANLYSRECYELYRSRLSDKGVVAQFLPLHELSIDDFRMVVNTFRSVFPHTTVWFTHLPQLIMVGTRDELEIDFEALKGRMEDRKVKEDLRLCGLDNPFALISCLLLDENSVGEFLGDYKGINTDDRPYLDFSAPADYSVNTAASNLEEVLGYRPEGVFDVLVNTGNGDEPGILETGLKGYYKAKEFIIKGSVYKLKGRLPEEIAQYNEALKVSPLNREANKLFRKAYARLYKR